jgi:hypothetical protein
MKEIFQKLALKGYSIYNKRVLGNPLYTSEETRLRDITQEIALVVEWLRVNHGIWIKIGMEDTENYTIVFDYTILKTIKTDVLEVSFDSKKSDFNTPQEAYNAGFNHVLNNLI